MKVLQILVSTNMDKVGRLQKANKLSSPLLSYKEIIQKRLLAWFIILLFAVSNWSKYRSWKISYLHYTFKYFSISFTRFKIYIWVKFKSKSLVKFPQRTITKCKMKNFSYLPEASSTSANTIQNPEICFKKILKLQLFNVCFNIQSTHQFIFPYLSGRLKSSHIFFNISPRALKFCMKPPTPLYGKW